MRVSKHLALSLILISAPALANGRDRDPSPTNAADWSAAANSPAPAGPAEAGASGEAGVPALVADAARRNSVPPRLLHGIVMVESGYNCRAHHGPWQGIGQLLPATARSVGVTGSLYDCGNGVEAAARYARIALERAGGDWQGAATLYNQGVFARPRRSAYSARVMRFAAQAI